MGQLFYPFYAGYSETPSINQTLIVAVNCSILIWKYLYILKFFFCQVIIALNMPV
jgi:hypothetical protein